jgi:hypothetical protein
VQCSVHVSICTATYGCARLSSKQQHAHGHTEGLGAGAQGDCSLVVGAGHDYRVPREV